MGWVMSKHENNNCISDMEILPLENSQTFLKCADENIVSEISCDSEFEEKLVEIPKISSKELNILTIDHDYYDNSDMLFMRTITNLENFVTEEKIKSAVIEKVDVSTKCDIRNPGSVRSRVGKIREIPRKLIPSIQRKCPTVLPLPKSIKNEESKSISKVENKIESKFNRTRQPQRPLPQNCPKKGLKIKRLPPLSDPSKPENKRIYSRCVVRKPSVFKGIPEIKPKKNNKVEQVFSRDVSLSVQENRNFSPLGVGDLERKISPRKTESEIDENEVTKKGSSRVLSTPKRRPQSAKISPKAISTVDKDSFNTVILEFNKKLEGLMKDSSIMNSCCTNCSSCNEPKTTAGKISFFFVKKYGNVGKFLLARLNELFDNVNNEANTSFLRQDALDSNFPLPCNINDIEFSGYLKPNLELPKIENRKSKLPKLILKSKLNKKDVDDKFDSNNNKIDDNFKVLPRIKSAKSGVNFEMVNSSSINTEEPFRTINISETDNLENYCFQDIVEVVNFNRYCHVIDTTPLNAINTCESNDCVENNDSIKGSVIRYNEEDVTILANKLIDDLWKNKFMNDYIASD